MPREPIDRADVNNHIAAWQEVEQLRKAIDKTQAQFAHMIGVSPGRYSGWKAQKEMPADIWREYQRIEYHNGDTEPQIDDRPINVIKVIRVPTQKHIDEQALAWLVETLPLEQCAVGWCDRHFYKRVWNQKYCNHCRESGDARRWHRQRN